MKRILFVYFFIVALSSWSFDGKSEYKSKMQIVIDKYLHANKLKMVITTSVTIREKGAERREETTTQIFADNDQYRYETGDLKFVMNRHCMVYVDERNKYIFYKKLDKPIYMKEYAQMNSLQSWFATFDSSLTYCKNVLCVPVAKGNYFSGTISRGQYEAFSVTILSDSTIADFCYDVRKTDRSQFIRYCTQFSETDFHPIFDKALFDESTIIKVSAKGIKLAPKYQSFTLKQL